MATSIDEGTDRNTITSINDQSSREILIAPNVTYDSNTQHDYTAESVSVDGDDEDNQDDRFYIGGRRLLKPTALAQQSCDMDSSVGGNSFYTKRDDKASFVYNPQENGINTSNRTGSTFSQLGEVKVQELSSYNGDHSLELSLNSHTMANKP